MCYFCGERKALHSCVCNSRMCDRHAHYYLDESNIAITNSARPLCPHCATPPVPRPYTLAHAIDRNEWWLD